MSKSEYKDVCAAPVGTKLNFPHAPSDFNNTTNVFNKQVAFA